MLVATVCACDVQILDGVAIGRIEHGATHLDGMSVAIEHTLEVQYGGTCFDVCIQNSIDAMTATSGDRISELFPVAGVVDDVDELFGGIAVRSRAVSAACPCLTAFGIGSDFVGHEEAVHNSDRTVGPAHEATVRVAIGTLKAAIKLTVGESGFGIGGLYNAYETTVSSITIHTAVKGHRRMAVLNVDSTSCKNLANETACKLMVVINGACRVQVADSGIAYISEGSKTFCAMVIYAESQRVAVAVESAAIVVFCFPADHDGTDINVGRENGIHIILTLGVLHHIPECSPVIGSTDDDQSCEITGSIAVDNRQYTTIVLAYPRLAAIGLGINACRGEKTVLNGFRSVLKATTNETADVTTICSIKNTIKLTVTE